MKDMYLVWSIEHDAWWGPNHCGYTKDALMAGAYTLVEAETICEGANKFLPPDSGPNEVLIPAHAVWPIARVAAAAVSLRDPLASIRALDEDAPVSYASKLADEMLVVLDEAEGGM